MRSGIRRCCAVRRNPSTLDFCGVGLPVLQGFVLGGVFPGGYHDGLLADGLDEFAGLVVEGQIVVVLRVRVEVLA